MADLGNFDARTIDPTKAIEVLPAGKYLAVIKASEMKENKARTGSYLQLTWEIIDGPYKGAPLWQRLNLSNPNPAAVESAKRDLSAVCRAVNVMEPRDSVALHNLPATLIVACKKREDTGEIANEIKGVELRSAYTASQAKPATNPAAGKPTTPAWARPTTASMTPPGETSAIDATGE